MMNVELDPSQNKILLPLKLYWTFYWMFYYTEPYLEDWESIRILQDLSDIIINISINTN